MNRDQQTETILLNSIYLKNLSLSTILQGFEMLGLIDYDKFYNLGSEYRENHLSIIYSLAFLFNINDYSNYYSYSSFGDSNNDLLDQIKIIKTDFLNNKSEYTKEIIYNIEIYNELSKKFDNTIAEIFNQSDLPNDDLISLKSELDSITLLKPFMKRLINDFMIYNEKNN